VHPLDGEPAPAEWRDFAARFMREHRLPGARAVLVAGPSPRDPRANHRLEFMQIEAD